MSVTNVLQLLREGLLDGVSVAVAEPARPELGSALADLGATVAPIAADPADEEAAAAKAIALGPVDALVVDAAARPQDDLVDVAAGVWAAVRAVANAAWIEPERPGKLVLLAPPSGEALRAALENLARTTSIEWARYGIRSTTIRPGPSTSETEVAALVAYLLSPAGDYFSGTALDLS